MDSTYKLKYHKLEPGVIAVDFPNGVHMGELLLKEDGYYDWWPALRGGYIEAWVLRDIANKLDDINKEWDNIVQNDPAISETKGT